MTTNNDTHAEPESDQPPDKLSDHSSGGSSEKSADQSKTADTTHFGFKDVPRDDKAQHVRGVFDSVANKYDLMNDVMSAGLHRIWKRYTLDMARLKPGQHALDVAGGTGDLAIKMAAMVGDKGHVVLSDINEAMLEQGRRRLIDEGIVGNVSCVLADAEHLPFEDDQFDVVTVAFGLRNVTNKDAALRAMHRVLKPGGQLLVLEFSKMVVPGVSKLYDWYSFNVLPKLGEALVNDADSYRYLAESIRMHPDQPTLLKMLDDAGFEQTRYHNLSGGIVALHRGFKV